MAARPVRLVALLSLAIFLSACVPIGDAAPVVKIGLIAPFEGLGRPLGYAILPEIRNAIDDANTDGSPGAYRVALVALNDELSGAEAEAQARALALDPEVAAVLGPWTGATLERAAPILAGEGIAIIGGAPIAASAGVANVCPAVNTLAEAMLARAAIGKIIIAGPENALAAALRAIEPRATRWLPDQISAEAPGSTDVVIHTGEAEAAASDLRGWRAAGWRGMMIGGPDMAQPWFGDLAGSSAEGALALVCGPVSGESRTPQQQTAQQAVEAALQAIAGAVEATGEPSRAAVAQALAERPLEAQAHWLYFTGDGWRADEDAP